MSDYPVTSGARPGDPHLRLRLAALTAIIVGVVLVALVAFLLSYTGIRQIALEAGVPPNLARLYPLMFDAMLIITCSGVLATRTAGWGTKTYVWLCLLLVLGAVAVGDAMYATGVHLTGQAARAAIAVIPWVLLLLGFGIWLVMLRHWRRVRTAGAVTGADADRATQADQNGHAGRAAPAGRPELAPQTAAARQAEQVPQAAAAAQPERIPQAASAGQADRAAPAMAAAAASAAAGGAAGWEATPARTRAPRAGVDSLLEQQAGRAPERAAAADNPPDGAAATGQGEQRATTPGERQPAGTTATAAGTAAGAATSTAAGAVAGIAAGKVAGATTGTNPGTAGDTKPGTAGDTKPGTAEKTGPGIAETTPATAGTAPGTAETTPATTAAASRPGTAETMPATTAGTRPGTAETTPAAAGTAPGIAETTAGTKPGTAAATPEASDTGAEAKAGADAKAGANAAGAADPAGTGRDDGDEDKAPAEERRRRLGGLLEMPPIEDDGEGSVRILPAQPKDQPGEASREDGEARTPAGAAAVTEPDPANQPAPLPHFDRPRSTPTPPRESGADGE